VLLSRFHSVRCFGLSDDELFVVYLLQVDPSSSQVLREFSLLHDLVRTLYLLSALFLDPLHGLVVCEIPYYTFAHPLAIRPLKHYLRKRRDKYGSLGDDYPLLHSNWNHWSRDERNKKRLDRRSVQRVVKTAAERAGLSEWNKIFPHCLRKAFKSVLRAPTESGGRLDEGTQEYLMGHILPGTQDEYYDKGNVDFHRGEYAKLDFTDNQSMQRIEEKGAEEVEGPDKVVKKGKLSEYLGRGWIYLEKIDDEQFIIRKAEATDGVKT